ncbi:hypothetical protein ACFXG4_27030 [Nocardia sp. NPDC059246]|uniref:hypothetical protein n=1 Tax=unclassified Nocardia TaxID=2637762 RepID=UPI0036A6FE0D
MTDVLPTEPGVYEDAIGDLWVLRDDGRWQYSARRLKFGGISTNVDHRPIDAEELAACGDPELLPLKRIEAQDTLPW